MTAAEWRRAETDERQKAAKRVGSRRPARLTHLAEKSNAEQVERERDAALGLLNRWLSQHRDGVAMDPCGVAPCLVEETKEAVIR